MKKTIKVIWPILLSVLVLISIGYTAVAQRGKGGRNGNGWKFVAEKYDSNKDGEVSLDEYTRGETGFKSLDTNSDGVVNEDDWKGRSRKRHGDDNAPRAGEVAPDFSLTEIRNPKTIVTLSDFAGQKPVALLFGSCT